MDYKEEYIAINSQIRSFVEYKRNVRQDEIRYIYAIKEAKDRILSEAGSCITCLIICDRICQTIKKKRKETS